MRTCMNLCMCKPQDCYPPALGQSRELQRHIQRIRACEYLIKDNCKLCGMASKRRATGAENLLLLVRSLQAHVEHTSSTFSAKAEGSKAFSF